MYKKQMTFQRIVCLLSIVASALIFLYALGMMTDLYNMLYTMIPDPSDPGSAKVAGAMIYYDMQDFNRGLLRGSIGLILLSCLLFVTNTHSRRKYYVGNIAAVALNVLANAAMAEHQRARMRRNHFSNFCNVGFGTAMRGLSAFGALYGLRRAEAERERGLSEPAKRASSTAAPPERGAVSPH